MEHAFHARVNALISARNEPDGKWNRVRLRDPLDVMHLLLTCIVGWWFFLLVTNKLKLDAVDVSFSAFLPLMPRLAWVCLFAVVFAVGLAGLTRRSWVRFSTQALSLLHGSIALLIALSGAWTTGEGVYALLAIFSGYLVWARRSM